MKPFITFAVVIALLVFSSEGRSQQPTARTIYGAGADSCGKWTAARKGTEWYQDAQWMLGFVSAANSFAETPPRHTDSDAMTAWMDNYCTANPLKDVSDAAKALLVELGTRF